MRSRMSTSVRSWVSRTSTSFRCSTSTAAALEFKDANISPFRGSRTPTSDRGSTSTATTCRVHRLRNRALSGWDSAATTAPPCSCSSHRDRPRQLRARPRCSPLLGQTGDRAADSSQVVAGRPRRVHRRAAANLVERFFVLVAGRPCRGRGFWPQGDLVVWNLCENPLKPEAPGRPEHCQTCSSRLRTCGWMMA